MKKAIVIALAALLPVVTEAAAPVAAPTAPTASATAPSPAPMPVSVPPTTTPTVTTPTSAYVAAPSVDTGSDRLSDLQARIPLLKAQAEIAELQARIRTASNVNSGATSNAAATPTAPSAPLVIPKAGNTSGIDLVSVRGYKGQYTASLEINGNVVQVSQGDSVDGGWIVSSITGSEVRLTRKGATRIVGM